MFKSGELITVATNCHGLREKQVQIPLPGIASTDLCCLSAGDTGLVIGSVFYEEVGWLTEALFGNEIIHDICSEYLVLAGPI